LLKDYEFNVIDSPSELEFDDGSKIFMMPWICTDNYNQSMEAIKTTDAQVLFGHFEIAGFQMYKGHENDEGFDPKIFEKFDLVCSGHFHHRSSNGNINYLGNPYELTWADFEDPRGFHIFDTSTRELDFIPNRNETYISQYRFHLRGIYKSIDVLSQFVRTNVW
jgi:DNA repair exonuclease SbcCD nuclease subunit